MKATIVTANQPINAMISARRRSSRCSTMDMRASGSRATELRRPLIRRAIGRRLALLLGFGLLGLACRVDRGGLLRLACRVDRGGRLWHVDRGLHLVGDVARDLPELANAAAEGPAELGQLARSEDDQDDCQEYEQVSRMQIEGHVLPPAIIRSRRALDPRSSGPFHVHAEDAVRVRELAHDVEPKNDRPEVVVDVRRIATRPGRLENEELRPADGPVRESRHTERAGHPAVVRCRRFRRQQVARTTTPAVLWVTALDDPVLAAKERQAVEVAVLGQDDEVVSRPRSLTREEVERDVPLRGLYRRPVLRPGVDAHGWWPAVLLGGELRPCSAAGEGADRMRAHGQVDPDPRTYHQSHGKRRDPEGDHRAHRLRGRLGCGLGRGDTPLWHGLQSYVGGGAPSAQSARQDPSAGGCAAQSSISRMAGTPSPKRISATSLNRSGTAVTRSSCPISPLA